MRALSALTPLVLMVAGCFPPDLGNGAVACGTGDICPPGYLCRGDKRCWKTPEGGYDFAGLDFTNCTRVTCDGERCGVIPDGCGSTIDCGNMCGPGKTCGGGTTPYVCGCGTQVSCGTRNCGTMPDGCGGVVSCGSTTCPPGQTCGGGAASPNVCNTGNCTIRTCRKDKDCGLISDGCSAVLDCGSCPSGKSCGAGGPNLCG